MTAASSDPLQRWQELWGHVVERCLAGHAQVSRFELTFVTVGRWVHSTVTSWRGDVEVHYAQSNSVAPVPDCADLLEELRRIEHDPTTGTFLSAQVTGTSLRAFTARTQRYTDDSGPPTPAPQVEDLAAELEIFPRSQLPRWWSTALAGVHDQLQELEAPRTGQAVPFDWEEDPKTPPVRLQFVAVVGAVAAATGKVTLHVTVSDDGRRVTMEMGTRRYTLQLVDDDRAVVSGRVLTDEWVADVAAPETLFVGAPQWLQAEHLDDLVTVGQLTFCAWYDNGQWARSPELPDELIRYQCAAMGSSSDSAYGMSYVLDPRVERGTPESESVAERCFVWVSHSNSYTVRPITTEQFTRLLDTHPRERLSGEIDSSIDYLTAWDLLTAVGLNADAGPQQLIDDTIREIRTILGTNELHVATAGNESNYTWRDGSTTTDRDRIGPLLRRLRQLMFRRGHGTWWHAEFTRTTARFTNPTQRPPRTLPPGAYLTDLQKFWAPTPGWLQHLWLTQPHALTTPDTTTPDTIDGLDPFPAIAGRWAAIAGISFASAPPEDRNPATFPITTNNDGLWAKSSYGYTLRLTPLPNGRAVLSGTHTPGATTDPTTVLTALPDWITITDLHPLVDHSGLTICWWWDGNQWHCSPTAATRHPDQLPIPWATSHNTAIQVTTNIAHTGGHTLTTDAITHYVTTSETDPHTAQHILTTLIPPNPTPT